MARDPPTSLFPRMLVLTSFQRIFRTKFLEPVRSHQGTCVKTHRLPHKWTSLRSVLLPSNVWRAPSMARSAAGTPIHVTAWQRHSSKDAVTPVSCTRIHRSPRERSVNTNKNAESILESSSFSTKGTRIRRNKLVRPPTSRFSGRPLQNETAKPL